MNEIKTRHAPAAVGPYSQAILEGKLVFCAGQIGLDPKTGTLVKGGIEQQAKQVCKNIDAVLRAAKSSPARVIMTHIYLRNMKHVALVNDVYAQFFSHKPYPARVTIGVSSLPKGALIEISCIATKK